MTKYDLHKNTARGQNVAEVLLVHPFVLYRLLTRKQKSTEKNETGINVSRGKSNRCANIHFKRSP